MPIFSLEIMKPIDERETQNEKTETTKQTNKQRQKRAKGTEAIVKKWEINDFVLHLS